MRSSRLQLVFALLLGLLLLSSCLEFLQKIEIRSDGSGRMAVEIRVQKQTLERLKARMREMGLGEQEPKDPFDVALVRRRFEKAKDVELVSLEKIDDEKFRGMKAVLDFKDAAALRAGMRAFIQDKKTKVGKEMEMFFLRAGPGHVRFVFYPSGRKEYERAKTQVADLAKMSAQQRAVQDQVFGMMKKSMAGIRISYNFVMPGKIFSVKGAVKGAAKDATLLGERTARLDVLEKDLAGPSDVARLSGLRFEIDFDAAGFTGKVLDKEPGAKESPAQIKKVQTKK